MEDSHLSLASPHQLKRLTADRLVNMRHVLQSDSGDYTYLSVPCDSYSLVFFIIPICPPCSGFWKYRPLDHLSHGVSAFGVTGLTAWNKAKAE